jgi:outer membrane immunogenic protein
MAARFSLIACVALVAGATSSFAADLPTKKGPPPAPMMAAPAFSWTGFYLGLNAGGAWGSTNINDNYALGPIFGIPASQTINADSFIGGAQAGYNYQFGGNFVIGGEVEFDGMDLNASKTIPLLGGFGADLRKSDADWLATGGLRLGYAVDRLLFFVKGGGAVTDYRYQDETAFGGTLFNNATGDVDRWGWMIGGGVEWAFATNWTVKAEYDYIGFDRQGITLSSVGGVLPAAIPLSISDNISLAKLGVNYKF